MPWILRAPSFCSRDFVAKLNHEPVARPIVDAVFDKPRTVVGDTQFEDEIGLFFRRGT